MNYHRIVVKLGTNLLTAGSDRLNLETMASLVGQVARLHKEGLVIVVVSSGAIAAGKHRLGITEEQEETTSKQVLAAVGQSRLMDAYDKLFGWHEITIAQTLLTRADLSDRLRYLNARNTLMALLELRVIPIVNENDVVAVEEIQEIIFGDNDNLSAMVANLVDADLLILLTDIAGLYTADPHRDSKAKLIKRVEKIDVSIEGLAGGSSSERGTGGMATKIEAAKLATTSGVAVVIANGQEPDVIVRLAKGDAIGTFFQPVASRLESRKRWLLSQLSKGKLYVDTGAATALLKQNKSLLPAGVTKVSGEFERGDVVNIFDGKTGEKIACGISNYGSDDIAIIKGAHSDRISDLLGHEYGAELVHRDNLVAL
ncbi:MAG TPA: glutamate 5-kinase [Dehalococcoidia bacterium]|nr:glutamate 5-kinase [Dehalococcoidia bacterium]